MSRQPHSRGGARQWLGSPAAAGLVAWLTASAVAALVFAHSLGPGQYLYRDFVGVPDPAGPATLFPRSATELRSWPLDAVTWLLSGVVPVGVQQSAILLGGVVLAAAGAGVLLRHHGPAASAAASAAAAWNPYVAERLLLGQPPTLLGYAALPWVLMAARSTRPVGVRVCLLVVAAAPAALTPWGGVMAAGIAAVGAASRMRWTNRSPGPGAASWLAVVVGAAALWCLPWVVPALLAGAPVGDATGAAAFALSDDSGLGRFGSALFGGGTWAPAAVPLSRPDPLSVAASVLLLVAAVTGLVVLARRGRGPLAALAGVALFGPALLAWLASGPLLAMVTELQGVPGMSLLRDLHRDLAPGVLVAAVLLGVTVSGLRGHGSRLLPVAGAASALLLAGTTVPDLPLDVAAAYRPVVYPSDWPRLVAALRSEPGAVVVSLPWQPLRQVAWAGDQPFLDPLPRAVTGEVRISQVLTVSRDHRSLAVSEGDPSYAAGWADGRVTNASLRRAGATLVVEWVGTPGPAVQPAGWQQVISGRDFRLWRVPSNG